MKKKRASSEHFEPLFAAFDVEERRAQSSRNHWKLVWLVLAGGAIFALVWTQAY